MINRAAPYNYHHFASKIERTTITRGSVSCSADEGAWPTSLKTCILRTGSQTLSSDLHLCHGNTPLPHTSKKKLNNDTITNMKIIPIHCLRKPKARRLRELPVDGWIKTRLAPSQNSSLIWKPAHLHRKPGTKGHFHRWDAMTVVLTVKKHVNARPGHLIKPQQLSACGPSSTVRSSSGVNGKGVRITTPSWHTSESHVMLNHYPRVRLHLEVLVGVTIIVLEPFLMLVCDGYNWKRYLWLALITTQTK